jgi:hypothetical protein
MAAEDAEAFLRALVAPLSRARRDTPLPGVPFSREAVANAFVMLGLLPEALAEEILALYRPLLKAEGFEIGVLTGELSVRPGAHGYHDALVAGPPGRRAGPGQAPAPAGAATGTSGRRVELETAEITAAVADALLWVGALPPDSALLTHDLAAGSGRSG